MLFTASFLANAGLNFVLGLAIAAVLGPAEFGRYAMAAAIGLLVSGLFFFWMANSASRFYSEQARTEAPEVRGTLDRCLGATAATALVAAVLVLLTGLDFGLDGGLVALALLVGVGHGLFDYSSALSRSLFKEELFARIVIGKNVIGFSAMIGAAWYFRDAHAVLAALAISTVLALLPVLPQLVDRQRGPFDRGRLRIFLGYAGPHVVALGIYQLMPFINRSLLADWYGYAESGQFSLTYDTIYRIFAAVGSSLDYMLFQFAVRDHERHGPEAGEARLGRNLLIVVGAMAPATIGFLLVLPMLSVLVVPAEFRVGFQTYTVLLLPAVIAQSIVVSGLSAVFQIRKRTLPIVIVALIGLAADAALTAVLPHRFGPAGFALAQSGAMLVVLLATLAWAWPVLRRVLPLRDIGWCIKAALMMGFAVWPIREAEQAPIVGLLLTATAGAVFYVATLIVGDVGGLRRALEARLERRRAARPGAAKG